MPTPPLEAVAQGSHIARGSKRSMTEELFLLAEQLAMTIEENPRDQQSDKFIFRPPSERGAEA